MQTVGEPLRFHNAQQSQFQWAVESTHTPPGDAGIHRPERPVFDIRRLATNRVTKSIRKSKVVRRQTPQREPSAADHQDNRVLLPMAAINDEGRDSLGTMRIRKL